MMHLWIADAMEKLDTRAYSHLIDIFAVLQKMIGILSDV